MLIPVKPENLFAVYFTVWFIFLAVLWIRAEWRSRKNLDWTVVKEHLYVCGKCHLSFLAKRDGENIMRCPRCNEMCFLKNRKRF